MEQADIQALLKQIKSVLGTGTSPNQIWVDVIPSPIGTLLAGASELGLCFLSFIDSDSLVQTLSSIKRTYKATFVYEPNEILTRCKAQLDSYFDGALTQFDLEFDLVGTDFQKQVWNELWQIPFAKTISYKEVAHRINNEKAVRAVGTAIGANPVPVILPCHRVIGENGKLVGYSGGLWRKEFLLKLENK
jgi:O-6-methylguanine DNA methyltransferase